MWDLIRLSAQPVRVLVRPSEEDLAWTAERSPSHEEDSRQEDCRQRGEEKFKDEFCRELSRWLGWGACAFSSWEDTCRRIAEAPSSLVRHLNSTLFAPAEVTCQVVNVEPTCLHGLHGDEMADITWWKRFLTSYIESNYDHSGRVTSTTTANADPVLAQSLGRPPNLSVFLLSGPLQKQSMTVQAEVERLQIEADQRGDVYLVLLDQRYNCQQQDPPHGRLTWRSCSVLIWMEMGLKAFITAQLSVTWSADGMVEITTTNLAGAGMSCWKGHPSQETFAGLQEAIAHATGHLAFNIRMILPSGQLVDKDMLPKRLDDVLRDGD
mmetsp:Transcript_32038/g.74837  ORF Transcript_32038/g.74837 Transcript_32038/m.74837 type:complete len:323 (+) Transcript_32038:60-1028(+)